MAWRRPEVRALVVQHTPGGGPGRLGAWLREAGVALEVLHAYDGDPVPAAPRRAEHHAVIVLGGGFTPDDDKRAPWLAPTRALVASALADRVPILGICLGGQLLAHVAGGTVTADVGRPEIGSTPVALRPEAAEDPLFHGLPATVPAIERHVDAITTLPPDAVWLAQTAACPHQAFRLGSTAWGVQFHPEVTAERLRGWNPDGIRAHGLDPAQLHRQAAADEPAAAAAWHTVTRRFAALAREQGHDHDHDHEHADRPPGAP